MNMYCLEGGKKGVSTGVCSLWMVLRYVFQKLSLCIGRNRDVLPDDCSRTSIGQLTGLSQSLYQHESLYVIYNKKRRNFLRDFIRIL